MSSPYLHVAVISLILTGVSLLSRDAQATTSRVAALSNNAGFIDDTDFFLFPSAMVDQPARASLNYYGGTGADGGLLLNGDGSSQALWFQRHSAAGLPAGGFKALYGSASGDTGFLVRAGQDGAGLLTLGGAWSNGGGKGEPQNLAVGGDLRVFGNLTNQVAVGLNVAVTGRTLEQSRLTLWQAGLDYYSDDQQVALFGGYTFGPRFRRDELAVALQVGPMGRITVPTSDGGDSLLDFNVPFTNLGLEYDLREWLTLRGSMVATFIGSTSSADLVESLSWSVAPGGALGVGFSHRAAQFDLNLNPTWALSGPYLLSGTATPMLAQLSARFDL